SPPCPPRREWHPAATGPSPPAGSPSTSPTPRTRRFWPLPPRTDCIRSTERRCSSNRPWPNPRCSSAPPGHRSASREPSCGSGSRRPCTPHSSTRARRPRTERNHAVETGVLHGMIIGLTVLIALATGLVVSRTAGAWIADSAQTAVFERAGAAARGRTVVTGNVIAALAAWFLPVDTVLSGAAGRAGTAVSARPAAFERAGAAGRVRAVGTGIVIAAVAAWFLPVDTVLSGAAGRAEAAYQSAAVGAVPAVSESVDHLAAALILGSVA